MKRRKSRNVLKGRRKSLGKKTIYLDKNIEFDNNEAHKLEFSGIKKAAAPMSGPHDSATELADIFI